MYRRKKLLSLLLVLAMLLSFCPAAFAGEAEPEVTEMTEEEYSSLVESLTLSRLNKGNFVNGRLHEN